MRIKTVLTIAGVLLISSAFINAQASESAAREVCKQFLTARGYVVQDWGKSWDWTAIDNKDGSWSVGAKFFGAAPGRGEASLYVVCIANKKGDSWSLVRLSRMY